MFRGPTCESVSVIGLPDDRSAWHVAHSSGLCVVSMRDSSWHDLHIACVGSVGTSFCVVGGFEVALSVSPVGRCKPYSLSLVMWVSQL